MWVKNKCIISGVRECIVIKNTVGCIYNDEEDGSSETERNNMCSNGASIGE